ncbi:MAG TPA: (2Fe-2S)-binding protein [Tepidisphaeraceae bacterium]|nr:(2Fe-2S)-binding protein [Tepidisphaeraceae bacterium]
MPMSQITRIQLNVNGRDVDVSTEGGRSLLELLREDLQLTGTKYGCGEGACGACAVLVDGKKTFSCSTLLSQVAGKPITTIEGLAKGDELHPVQEAFVQASAFQCGYCTPGMVMATIALLETTPKPTDEQICDGLDGHLCRCCGYANIQDAVKRAAEGHPSER